MPFPLVLLSPLLDIAGKIFDRVIPDKAAAEKAKAEFAATAQTEDFQLMLAQIQTNAAEAASPNWFVAGWRPFVGWVCGVALAYTYVLLPLLQFVVFTWGSAETVGQFSKLPKLELADLLPILLGMLGLAGYRTIEKARGVEDRR